MAIKFSPKAGQIIWCDFTKGFIEPEMVKKRPVIVVATRPTGHRLATVACLSTVEPFPIDKHHIKIDKAHLPNIPFFRSNGTTWLKGDMVYAVSFDRLDMIHCGKGQDGRRIYFQDRLGRETMKNVYSCLLHGLGLHTLCEHL